ncbi:MAG: Ig-like domain-containing protein, partial [Roseiflexaceae bacterium]
APSSGDRWVAPRAPLALRLSQSLDLADIRAGFVITPTNTGALMAVTLPDATQWITFTPSADWQPGTTYTAALSAGDSATAPEVARWSYTAAPRPAVIGRFPGEGQTLPPGQDIRLIFNTPVDGDALQAALRLTPPAGAIRVSAGDVEARISAEMRASTVYTLTLPASLTDRNGVPLGREYQIRFVTASAGSILELPDAPAHITQVPPGQPASLRVRRTNLSALNLDLYSLDEATTVRALAFEDRDWRDFQPERYGQPLLRSWVVPLTDTLNTVVEDRLPVALVGAQPLSPGVYYLRVRTPEGPRVDLLVLVSRVRLALQSSPAGTLIWATDVISATPVAALPVELYQDGALIQRGATGPDGLWHVARAGGAAGPRSIALATGDRPAIASSAWSDVAGAAPIDGYRAWLATDRAAYRPGERIAFAGFVRRVAGQSNILPPGLQAQLTTRQLGAPDLLYRQTIDIGSTGLISASFALPAGARPGEYIVGAAIAGAIFHTTFVVRAEVDPPLDLTIEAPGQVAAGEEMSLPIMVRTPDGAPVAGAAISWTLGIERLPFPARADYIFGDDELAFERPETRSGAGQADADGRFSLAISDIITGAVPLRYRLTVRATEPGGPAIEAERSFLFLPSQVYAGVRLPSRLLLAAQPGAIEVLAVTPQGQLVPGALFELVVYRRVWAQPEAADSSGDPSTISQPRDERVVVKAGVTGADGMVSLPLTLREAGEYRVQISIADSAGRRMSSAISLWVAAPGFTDWGGADGASARLIADRALYRPGETATLLLAMPHADSTALVTIARDDGISAVVRSLRAGEPLTITLTPEDAPAVRVAVLLASPAVTATEAVPPLALATTTLPVLSADRVLSMTLVADRTSYAPGATAALTITTTDASGAGVPSNIILSLVGASAARRSDIAGAFHSVVPPALATAWVHGAPPAAAAALVQPLPLVASIPAAQPAAGVYWSPTLRTGASGVLTLTVRLPNEVADLRALAWAASGADRFGQAQATLAVTQALTLHIDAPPFLRQGDVVELAALIQNTSAVFQRVSVSLAVTGVEARGTPPTRQIAIAPGTTVRLAWTVLAGTANRAALSFSLDPAGGSPQNIRLDRPILPVLMPAPRAGGIGLLREYLDPLTGRPLDLARLRAGRLVRVRLTIVNTEQRRAVANDEPLPGGSSIVEAGGVSFVQVDRDTAMLRLSSDKLAPGIYQYRYLLRAVATGRYAAPATTARLLGSDLIGVGNAAALVIVER